MRSPSGRLSQYVLALLTATLPFTFVPHELGVAQLPTSLLTLTGFVFVALRNGALSERPTSAEWSLLLLGLLIGSRLLVEPIEGRTPGVFESLTLLAIPLGGYVLTRVAKVATLRTSIVAGLSVALVLLLAFELHQVLAGLDSLKALGYVYPDFIYHTESGAYRPFGTFRTPVTFGIYLAVIGFAVALSSRGWLRWVFALGAIVGVAATETRSAWIGSALAIAVLALQRLKRAQFRHLARLGALLYGLVVLGLVAPTIVRPLSNRLSTVFDSDFQSNSTRVELWKSTATAIADSPLVGHGTAPLTPYLPQAFQAQFSHPHNNFLQVAFAFGLVGLALFVAYFVSAWREVSTVRNAYAQGALAAATTFLVGSLFESMWTTFAVFGTVTLILGLGMRPLGSQSGSARADQQTSSLRTGPSNLTSLAGAAHRGADHRLDVVNESRPVA